MCFVLTGYLELFDLGLLLIGVDCFALVYCFGFGLTFRFCVGCICVLIVMICGRLHFTVLIDCLGVTLLGCWCHVFWVFSLGFVWCLWVFWWLGYSGWLMRWWFIYFVVGY